MVAKSAVSVRLVPVIKTIAQHTKTGKSLRWEQNSCWLDTALALKLVCMEALGEGYWTKEDGKTQRDVSQTERDQLNLMCSIVPRTVEEAMQLRNVYMYEVCRQQGLDEFQYDGDGYGGFNDCLNEVAWCADECDAYHAVTVTTNARVEVACTCDRMYQSTEMSLRSGVLRAGRTFQRPQGDVHQSWTIADAVRGFLQTDLGVPHKCRAHEAYTPAANAVPASHRSLRCRGVYVKTLVRIQFGAILVVSLEKHVQPIMEDEFQIGGRKFTLAGVALTNGNHYKARLLMGLRANKTSSLRQWLDYDDLSPQRVSVSQSQACTGSWGARYYARAVYYINTESDGRPVDVDIGGFN